MAAGGERVIALALADLPPGASACVQAFGTTIALFNVRGEIHAVSDRCPHHGGPLSRGRVTGARESDGPDRYAYDSQRPVLTCPWHHWQFDLRDGAALFDARIHLRSYRAEVQDGDIVLVNSRRTVVQPAVTRSRRTPPNVGQSV